MKGHKQTTDGVSYETDYAYNLSGAMVEQRYPSGRVVKNVLDASGDYANGTTNNNGNVLSQTITVPTVGQTPGFVATQTYSYDQWGQTCDIAIYGPC